MDPSRTGSGPPTGRRRRVACRSPAEEWLAYALAARVMMIRVSPDRFEAVDGPLGEELLTFAAWMERGHELGWPTLEDFEYHLTTLFPPVRPKGWLELRMLDSLPDPWWRVAAGVATALLEDADAGAAALEAVTGGVRWGRGGRPLALRRPPRPGRPGPAGRRPVGFSGRARTGWAASAPTGRRWPPPRPSTTASWPAAAAPPTTRPGSPRWNRPTWPDPDVNWLRARRRRRPGGWRRGGGPGRTGGRGRRPGGGRAPGPCRRRR